VRRSLEATVKEQIARAALAGNPPPHGDRIATQITAMQIIAVIATPIQTE
jgi:hypothetical protein